MLVQKGLANKAISSTNLAPYSSSILKKTHFSVAQINSFHHYFYLCIMDSIRQQKSARLIQKDLAEIFLLEGKNWFPNAMITVTQVRISPDMSIARVYLSLFAIKDKESLLQDISIRTNEIRKHLGNRIGKQVRIIPELKFFIDDSLDYMEKIDKALKQ